MTKKMLIDATHPEETRVAVVDGTRLEEFDFEIASRRQIKSNIYLAKVTRVEPSLQAAFVEYGGNRHGFLPFPEIHPDYYRIPVGGRQILDNDDEDEHYEPRRSRRGGGRERASQESGQEAGTEANGGNADGERSSGETSENDPDGDQSPGTALEATRAADPSITEDAPLSDIDGREPADADERSPHAMIEDQSAAGEARAEAQDADRAVGSEEAHDDRGRGSYADAGDEAQGDSGRDAQGEGGHDDPQAAEASAPSERAVVETIGGDEVEDAQRSRRSQMPRYKIQEVIKRRQIMLVQVSKEERGNKGAAVTTFLSLPGRYCVLMPNTSRGGGVSRKIANPTDRKRMKELISDLEVPDGMSVILRTAGVERSKAEIKRDLEYLLRLWESIRELTLHSTAPALIYEEGNLVKRAIRDLYSRDIGEIEIAGEEGYRQAKDFMRMLMPSHAKRVQPYRDHSIPLFFRYQVESQIDLIHNPVAHLRSGGYIVINQTEALVSIDVNSGRSTRERGIEETALKTNVEAADEIARQLRLRDLGGLIVIDFIDMDEPRHDAQVERRLKEAMKNDRARIQIGRISPFGLLELSRQRLHPSLIETNFHTCQHCLGTGLVRSIESASLLVLRAIEEEGIKHRAAELAVTVAGNIALYILNQKRGTLGAIEQRYGFSVRVLADDSLIPPEHRIERLRIKPPGTELPAPLNLTGVMVGNEPEDIEEDEEEEKPVAAAPESGEARSEDESGDRKRKRRRGRRRRGRDGRPEGSLEGGSAEESFDAQGREDGDGAAQANSEGDQAQDAGDDAEHQDDRTSAPGLELGTAHDDGSGAEGAARRRRRGRRGGRNRTRRGEEGLPLAMPGDQDFPADGEIGFGLTETEAVAAIIPSTASLPELVGYEASDAVDDLTAPTEPEPVRSVQARASAPRSNDAQESPAPSESPAAAPSPARSYETVNKEPEAPRRGWWKRLTE